MMTFSITPDVEVVLGLLTLIASSALGVLVYLQNRKSTTNQLFVLLAALISLYIVVNYLSLHPPGGHGQAQLFWIRIVMATTSLISPVVVLLVHTFPGERMTMRKRYLLSLLLLMAASVTASLLPFVFSGIEYPEGRPLPTPGPGIPIFFLDFIGLFLVSFGIIIHKYSRAAGGERVKLKGLLIGVISSFSLMGISTVIFVVLLKTSAAVFLGPIFPVILMSLIAYAIVKHHLFNVQVFATQMMVVIFSIVFFSKIFMVQSQTARIIDTVTFIAVVVFGAFLVRSVRKEIEQRQALAKVATSLEQANERLKELDQQKTEFLSIASHQLRTPLSIIKGYDELLSDGAYGKPTEKMLEIFGHIDETNERLIKLVDDFLDVTRIEQGRTIYVFAPTDLGALVNEIAGELKKTAEEKGLSLSCVVKLVPVFPFDEEKIRHVISNFIDNAMKYTPKGSVRVTVRALHGEAEVHVEDSGVGFGKKDGENFFQKFYRGENVRDVKACGTGLGLYVCRKFVEAHGGRVWAKSRGPGKGSDFGFALPMDRKNTPV